MITRFNTKREETRKIIVSSIVILIVLAIAPPALIATAQKTPDLTGIIVTYGFCYGCAFLLLIYCCYRYFHWSAQDDTCLLSERTLAILSPGKPVRFVKPHDITAVKPEGIKLLLANGTELKLPRLGYKLGDLSLPCKIVTTWFGKESLDAAKGAYRNAMRPSARAVITGMLLLAAGLLVALGLALAGMWREFAIFGDVGFIAANMVAGLYWFALTYNAGKLEFPLSVPSDPLFNRGPVQPGKPTLSPARRVEILRIPKERAKVIEQLGSALLVLLALCIFIPLCRMALSYEKIEQSLQALILLIVVDLILVAVYCLWRIYQTVVRGDILVTVLLSRRTLAVVRPRKPVIFVKPIECVSLVCGSNELMLRDGRTIKLDADGQLDEERTMCQALCQQWWPEAYGEDPSGIWSKISHPCRRNIAIGLGLVSLGFTMLVVDPSPWGTAIAHHFIVPGGILTLFGYWTGCRGHGRVIALAPPTT